MMRMAIILVIAFSCLFVFAVVMAGCMVHVETRSRVECNMTDQVCKAESSVERRGEGERP